MRKIAAGNWKMNGLISNLSEIRSLVERHATSDVEILICPPSTILSKACDICGTIAIGAQNCHTSQSGAYTGEISAQMIAELGAKFVIVGHSERRAEHGETNLIIQKKISAALEHGLTPILCIGETLDHRDKGQTLEIIETQLSDSLLADAANSEIVIAYEPIWAIGTGNIPTMSQIYEVHEFCRNMLMKRFGDIAQNIPLLYGGSVNGKNAAKIFDLPNVNGALVGGASIKANDFSKIIDALENANN